MRIHTHTRTYTHTGERAGRSEARHGEKNGYVFSICNSAARDLGGAYAMYQTGKSPKGILPPESIKNTDPDREATDRKNNTHALSLSRSTARVMA